MARFYLEIIITTKSSNSNNWIEQKLMKKFDLSNFSGVKIKFNVMEHHFPVDVLFLKL